MELRLTIEESMELPNKGASSNYLYSQDNTN